MTVPTNPTDRPSSTPTRPIVEAAVAALALFHPTDPEQAMNMLTLWVRRDELTDSDLVEIQDRMFPEVSDSCSPGTVAGINDTEVRQIAARLAELGFAIDPAGDPTYLVERINTLLSEGVTPTPPESEWSQPPACPPWCTGKHADDGQFRDCESEDMFVPQYDDLVASVCAGTTFDRATGVSSPTLVRVEDYRFTPQYARRPAGPGADPGGRPDRRLTSGMPDTTEARTLTGAGLSTE